MAAVLPACAGSAEPTSDDGADAVIRARGGASAESEARLAGALAKLLASLQRSGELRTHAGAAKDGVSRLLASCRSAAALVGGAGARGDDRCAASTADMVTRWTTDLPIVAAGHSSFDVKLEDAFFDACVEKQLNVLERHDSPSRCWHEGRQGCRPVAHEACRYIEESERAKSAFDAAVSTFVAHAGDQRAAAAQIASSLDRQCHDVAELTTAVAPTPGESTASEETQWSVDQVCFDHAARMLTALVGG